jgi:hypothetical protein
MRLAVGPQQPPARSVPRSTDGTGVEELDSEAANYISWYEAGRTWPQSSAPQIAGRPVSCLSVGTFDAGLRVCPTWNRPASQARGPGSLPGDPAVQQQAEAVVGEAAEAVPDALDLRAVETAQCGTGRNDADCAVVLQPHLTPGQDRQSFSRDAGKYGEWCRYAVSLWNVVHEPPLYGICTDCAIRAHQGGRP